MVDLLWPYLTLATSAFTSATILPGTSEAAFLALLYVRPQEWAWLWLTAGLFNGFGSVVSYGMGRLIPPKKQPSEKVLRWLRRWGVWSLLLAWLPLVGDGLPIAAGWLRLDFWKCCVMLLAGKFLRYAVLLAGAKGLSVW
ncbi:MAG: DedA family protein [Neisseria sp.]|nr:DedA family protein [Neisseria sp.]